MTRLRAVDLFSGAGGSSWGACASGAEIVAGFDAWDKARDAFTANFPKAAFFHDRLENLDPRAVRRRIGPIDLLLASPECTSHSPAKGNAKRSEASRQTAFQVTRFAEALKPRWIVIENVVSMRRWRHYRKFIQEIERLGYYISPQVLNSAHFGVAQRRRRLFLLCDREAMPRAVPRTAPNHRPASSILSLKAEYRWSDLRTSRRAKATIARAELAIQSLGDNKPFLLVYYGTDHSGGWQHLDQALRTITTVDRFAIVQPTASGHIMRMLQVPELKSAMGMPDNFCLGEHTRRDMIHLIGNAVCPPVMKAVVNTLIS